MGKKFKAEVQFLLSNEGGFSLPPHSGIRPQLEAGDVFTSCVVRSMDQQDVFEIGKPVLVELEILFWEEYKKKFTDDMKVILKDGNRVVARGRFIDPVIK